MAHARQSIRDEAKTMLTGLLTTGANVFKFRVYPMEAASLPGLIIFTNEEESEPASQGATREYLRELSLSVEGYAKATADVDDVLDTIAAEVEAAIEADRKLNGLAIDTVLESTAFDLNGEGEKQAGVITLTYKILYKS
ncbi:MAG: hypothetical protein GY771_01110 [bacterium]|nr:hypothetical protein [bacterium]